MSNFVCEKCGVEILEDNTGNYYTGCKHYPLEKREKKMKKEYIEKLEGKPDDLAERIRIIYLNKIYHDKPHGLSDKDIDMLASESLKYFREIVESSLSWVDNYRDAKGKTCCRCAISKDELLKKIGE